MKETKYTTYNYLLPRKKRELANYVRAFVGIPALVLFVLSFYIGLTEPLYFIFSGLLSEEDMEFLKEKIEMQKETKK